MPVGLAGRMCRKLVGGEGYSRQQRHNGHGWEGGRDKASGKASKAPEESSDLLYGCFF